MPLELPRDTTACYVDRKPLELLRHEYPELSGRRVVAPDIVDDGQTLTSLAPRSVDFVVANHFLEHCEDPIGALEAHARVLRDGGVVYLALPDRRRGVDQPRAPTPIGHLVRDHLEGPAWSRRAHYEDWVRAGDLPSRPLSARDVQDAAARLDERDASIHFHVWTPEEFAELIDRCRADGLPLAIEELTPNYHEFIAILRSASPARPR
jgi:SAM-dependent methyltransferase